MNDYEYYLRCKDCGVALFYTRSKRCHHCQNDARAFWVITIGITLLVSILAILANVAQADGGVRRDGPSLPASRFDVFALNTDGGIPCHAVTGEALCVPGAQARQAALALIEGPSAEKWREAARASAIEASALRDENHALRAAVDARAVEAAMHRAAASEQKARADALRAALDRQWWWSLVKIALPAAGALTFGYAIGRYVR
jgi:hypothetical protein